METVLVIAIIEKCIQYGPELVMAAIVALNKETISSEDIQNLKIVKEPEEY